MLVSFFVVFVASSSLVLGATLPSNPNGATILPTSSPIGLLNVSTVQDTIDIAQFARTGYCNLSLIANWTCGAACDAVAPVFTQALGGNGLDAPDWYVAYWPKKKALVINHEGTSVNKLHSDLIDLKFGQRHLDPQLFPGAGEDALAHDGFLQAQARSAQPILESIQKSLANGIVTTPGRTETPERIYVTGYSLGAAVAVLDAMFIRLHVHSSIPVSSISVGTPMVGNAAFAKWSDEVLAPADVNSIRIVNDHDIIPRLPASFLHSWSQSGVEYHLAPDGVTWYNCGAISKYGRNEHCSLGFPAHDGSVVSHWNLGNLTMIKVCPRD